MLITLRELKDNYDWEKVCEVLHINPWCINEGADDDSTWHVTTREAEQIGILAPTFDQLHKKYYELIMAVEQKHPNESRHETALRYIRERENSGDNVTKAGSN